MRIGFSFSSAGSGQVDLHVVCLMSNQRHDERNCSSWNAGYGRAPNKSARSSVLIFDVCIVRIDNTNLLCGKEGLAMT